MSYLTDERLGEELQRIHAAEGGQETTICVAEFPRRSVRFRAQIGDRTMDFSVPEDVLHNAPLSHVSEKYLRPLLIASAK